MKLIIYNNLHFTFVTLKCFSISSRHNAGHYIDIPYLVTAKSQAFWTKLSMPVLPSNRTAALLLVIT